MWMPMCVLIVRVVLHQAGLGNVAPVAKDDSMLKDWDKKQTYYLVRRCGLTSWTSLLIQTQQVKSESRKREVNSCFIKLVIMFSAHSNGPRDIRWADMPPSNYEESRRRGIMPALLAGWTVVINTCSTGALQAHDVQNSSAHRHFGGSKCM